MNKLCDGDNGSIQRSLSISLSVHNNEVNMIIGINQLH